MILINLLAIVDGVNQSQIHACVLSLHVHVHVHENLDPVYYYVDVHDVHHHVHVCVSESDFCVDGSEWFRFH